MSVGDEMNGMSPCGVMAKVLNSDITVSEFELASRWYVNFRPNTLVISLFILSSYKFTKNGLSIK